MKNEEIKQFFKVYEERFNKALAGDDDIAGTAGAFAACFIGANPNGVMCGSNNEDFRKNIPAGNAYYRSIGTKRMQIKHMDIMSLDEIHYSARVSWHSEYERKDGREISIDFDVIYMLQYIGNSPKIFAYITGDEQAELQKHGLI